MSRRSRLLLTAGLLIARKKDGCAARNLGRNLSRNLSRDPDRYGSLYSKFATAVSAAPGRLISVRML